VKVHVERFEQGGVRSESTIEVADVEALVRSLADAWSATVRFRLGRQEFAVSTSDGRAAILLAAGDDDFFDRLADASAPGWTEFVHGGQAAPHPSRHVMSIDEALRVVAELVARGGIELPSPRWERQGGIQP
jgi:hypothetical protein